MKWQRLRRGLALLVLLAVPPAGASAFEAFLKVEGMDGEATAPWHTNWIEVLAISNNLVRKEFPKPPDPAVDSSLVILKEMDKASPKLYLACAQRSVIPKVTLQALRPSSGGVAFYELNLSNVVVQRVEDTGETLGPHGRPVDRIILGYDGISWTYTRFTLRSGMPREYVASYWDLPQNAGGASTGAAVFKVTGIQKHPGQVLLSWLPDPGKTYRIFSGPRIDGAFSLLAEVTPPGFSMATYMAPIVGGAMFFAVEQKP